MVDREERLRHPKMGDRLVRRGRPLRSEREWRSATARCRGCFGSSGIRLPGDPGQVMQHEPRTRGLAFPTAAVVA
jgi:hypothetical protein